MDRIGSFDVAVDLLREELSSRGERKASELELRVLRPPKGELPLPEVAQGEATRILGRLCGEELSELLGGLDLWDQAERVLFYAPGLPQLR